MFNTAASLGTLASCFKFKYVGDVLTNVAPKTDNGKYFNSAHLRHNEAELADHLCVYMCTISLLIEGSF